MENTGRKSRQKLERAAILRATDSGARECWLTELHKCVKLTWNADTNGPCLEIGDHCLKQCFTFLTVALSRLKPLFRTHGDSKLLKLCFPLVVGQDQLESHTIKRMRLPRIVGGFDATPTHFRSAFLAQYLTIAPSVAKAASWIASDGNTGDRRSSQGRAGKIETRGTINGWKGDAERR